MKAEANLSSEQLKEIRRQCREMFGKTHDQRAQALAKDFPDVSFRILWACSRVSNGCSEKVWDFLVQGKATLFVIEEIIDLEIEAQNKLIDLCTEKGVNLTFPRVREYKKTGVLNGEAKKSEKGDKSESESKAAKNISFKASFTREQLIEMRSFIREMPETWSYDFRISELSKKYADIKQPTLIHYYRLLVGCTEKVWALYIEEKTKVSVMMEICSLDAGDQDYFIDEIIAKNLQPKAVSKARQYRKEHGWGWPECIARATGEVPANQPRKDMGNRRTLDGLLTEIADKGVRWRAMVQQAIDMVGEEEAKAGVHESIFTKVWVLRELIGNQYDFVNNRLQRYIGLIRKNLQKGSSERTEIPGREETNEPESEPEGEAPEMTPIPEAEKRSIKDRMSRHQEIE